MKEIEVVLTEDIQEKKNRLRSSGEKEEDQTTKYDEVRLLPHSLYG